MSRRRILILVGIAAAIWLAYLLREIWLPLCVAFLIAMVLDPVVDRMEQRGWKRPLATAAIFAAFFVVLIAALSLAVPALVKQAGQISDQVAQYIPTPGNQGRAHQSLERALNRAHAPAIVRAAVERAAVQLSLTLTRSSSWLSAHAPELLSNLIWLVMIPIVTFYALRDFHLILAKTLLLVPKEKRDFTQTVLAEVTTIFARFLRGLAIVSVLNGLATWLLLVLLRTPNAFTLGAIAGMLYSVPYFGALVTVVLVAGVSFLDGGPNYMLLVVGANIVLHQLLFDQVITPRILGGHVGLHPILSVIALVAGNVLLGVPGMLLAVPVAASIQFVIVTLQPKLSHEIEVSAPAAGDSYQTIEAATKKEHVSGEAAEAPDIHRAVSDAVEAVERRAGT